jgi:hypothetical protein
MLAKELLQELKDMRYIVKLQGQEFVTFKGLLHLAHKIGMEGNTSDCIYFDDKPTFDDKGNKIEPSYRCIFKCTVTMKNQKTFVAHGDASPKNVGKMIVPHLYRMAETRAMARALRFATGCGFTALEELGEREK